VVKLIYTWSSADGFSCFIINTNMPGNTLQEIELKIFNSVFIGYGLKKEAGCLPCFAIYSKFFMGIPSAERLVTDFS